MRPRTNPGEDVYVYRTYDGLYGWKVAVGQARRKGRCVSEPGLWWALRRALWSARRERRRADRDPWWYVETWSGDDE